MSEATVANVSEKFLQHVASRCNRHEVGAGYLEQLRCSLMDFARCVGADRQMSRVGELDLEDYKTHTLDRPHSSKTGRPIRPATAQGRLGGVRTMIRWAWRMHIIENLPRNLQDIAKVPNGGQPEVCVFTMDELSLIWEFALGRIRNRTRTRTRCWIALTLNCGMGQQDISDLKVGEIDWTGGYIIRERSKTGVKTKHKLWQMTLDLLREHAPANAAPGDSVFKTEEGLPLVRRIIQNGKFYHSDAVKNAFDRALRKAGLLGHRGFYCLRKTGASLIESIDPMATEMYLSHVENGMKKHYADRDWGRLERALVEMERRVRPLFEQADRLPQATG